MNMKRSLTLTTIIMVVLLLIALSTATFAWFSASNVVNIASLTFTASSRQNVGGGEGDSGTLKLTWVANATEDDLHADISMLNGTNMVPMIPLTAPTLTTTYDEFVASFRTATQATAEGTTFYASNPMQATPYTCLNPEDLNQKTFYLHNTGNFVSLVTLGYGMDGENATALRVAVFINGLYVGTLRHGDMYYGTIVKGANVASQSKVSYDDTEETKFFIAANTAVEVNLVAWFDGVLLNDDGAELDARLIDITFRGAFVSQG